jgi:F-type H+-transporting ATPase subunit b
MDKLVTPDIGVIFWTVVTFIVVLFILGKFVWKPIISAIDEREKSIRDDIEKAHKSREEAEEFITKQKELLEEARKESSAMIEEGKKTAEKVKTDLLEQAKRAEREIVEQGRKKVEQEARIAIQGIKEQAADLAITAAKKLMISSMGEKEQKKLVEDYIKELSEEEHV